MQEVSLRIDGMHCGHCVEAVRRALSQVDGAAVTRVDIGKAQVELPPGTSPDPLVAAVERAGYHVSAVEAG
ncbi:MAG: heavy-metal-associated domain-containing protein [Gemmatimonadales bacterium]